MIRKINFPNAFVVDYSESFGQEEGAGSFSIFLKQKKDKTESTKIEGGYTV